MNERVKILFNNMYRFFGKYKPNGTYKCLCKNCGNIFETTWGNFVSRKVKCKFCKDIPIKK